MTLKHRTTINNDLHLIHILQTESAAEAAAALAAPDLLDALEDVFPTMRIAGFTDDGRGDCTITEAQLEKVRTAIAKARQTKALVVMEATADELEVYP